MKNKSEEIFLIKEDLEALRDSIKWTEENLKYYKDKHANLFSKYIEIIISDVRKE